MKHQQPIVNQFLESEQDFNYDINNRNLCFGGSAGEAAKSVTKNVAKVVTGGYEGDLVYNPQGAEQLADELYSIAKTNIESFDPLSNPFKRETSTEGTPDYGQTQDDTTDVTTDDTMNETTMTAEEKRNKLRQLMASRYGRRETILTGGTGLSDFGV